MLAALALSIASPATADGGDHSADGTDALDALDVGATPGATARRTGTTVATGGADCPHATLLTGVGGRRSVVLHQLDGDVTDDPAYPIPPGRFRGGFGIAVSHDCSRVVAGNDDMTSYDELDLATGRTTTRRVRTTLAGRVHPLADGRVVGWRSGYDGTEVMDLATGASVWLVPRSVYGLGNADSFSRDGSGLALTRVARRGHEVVVFSADADRPVLQLELTRFTSVTGVSLSPDRRHVIVVDHGTWTRYMR